MTSYKIVNSPLTLGKVTLRNRVVMGSMHTGLEEELGGFKKLATFYRQRAEGGVGLIITGGIAPNRQGRLSPFGAKLTNFIEKRKHQELTRATNEGGAKIAMQILHAGRYGYQPFIVAPSNIKSPITPFSPRAMTEKLVEETIQDFVSAAQLAQEAGYHGVEIMGSEGYLINQFIVERTNQRRDDWGGSYEKRIRFPLEIVRRTRKAVGENFLIIYRISLADLVEKGSTWEEVVSLARQVMQAGASVLNSGIGWHEAKIPTIATMVPRGAFRSFTARLKNETNLPLIATNRINTLTLAEEILQRGEADMISMARPFLADAEIVQKSLEGRENEVNTCIACNQACLDHTFKGKRSSCLVNPVACHELDYQFAKTKKAKKIAVVGAGPAGMAFSLKASERGHQVTLIEKDAELGGQLNMAKMVPGKEEFFEMLRYFKVNLEKNGVELKLNCEANIQRLHEGHYDEVVLALGVLPRKISFPGVESEKVLSYVDVLKHRRQVGKSVAIIGAGGIGFDVAEFLSMGVGEASESLDASIFFAHWGVDASGGSVRGGLSSGRRAVDSPREIYLLQRSSGKFGVGLGKTTGWIHRASLLQRKVQFISGVEYKKFDESGLHIVSEKGGKQILAVENVVVCAGQWPLQSLVQDLEFEKMKFHVIGGARDARGLDAKRAIREAYQLADKI